MSTASNITLYSFGTPNGIKVSITLEELGLPYKTEAINIMTNAQKEPWFVEINPNGKIPAIKDGNPRIFESGAIMQYLVDTYDLEGKISYKQPQPEYYEQLSWLMFQMGGLGPMQGQAFQFRAMAPVRSNFGIGRFMDEVKRLYSVLDTRLAISPYLAGSKYTIADIASYPWVKGAATTIGLDISEWPNLSRWAERIAKREAVTKGANVPPSSRTPEAMTAFFASMREKMDERGNTDLL